MIRFINRITGGEMLVAEERAEEYKAAGHVPVADSKSKNAKSSSTKRRAVKK